MLLSVFIAAFGSSLHILLLFFFGDIYYIVFPSYGFTFLSYTAPMCHFFPVLALRKGSFVFIKKEIMVEGNVCRVHEIVLDPLP